jgi:soluble lytic murein transglycosylase-like protein
MKRKSLDRWRSICDCKEHRRWSFRTLLRFPAALLIGVPIAFGAVKFPATDSAAEPFVAVSEPAARPQAPDQILDADLNLTDEVEFRLITPRIKNEFLADKIRKDTFSMEVVKAEFFRTQVPYGAIIYREARRHNLPPELVAAIVEAESGFRPALTSPKSAMGLMQLIPSTGEMMGGSRSDLFNPSENVRLGTKYLRYLHDRFGGDQRLILAAYNAGETTVRRYGGVPPYPETQDYLLKVARSKQNYQRQLARRVAELTELISSE